MSLVTTDRRNIPRLTAEDLIKAAKLDPPADAAHAQVEKEMFGGSPHILEEARLNNLKVPLNILQMHLESDQDVILSCALIIHPPYLILNDRFKRAGGEISTKAA